MAIEGGGGGGLNGAGQRTGFDLDMERRGSKGLGEGMCGI